MQNQKKYPKTKKFNPSKTRAKVLFHLCKSIPYLPYEKLESNIKEDNLHSICNILGIEPIYRVINSENTKQQIMNFITKTKNLSIDSEKLEQLMLTENWDELIRLLKLKPYGEIIKHKETTEYIYQYLCEVTLANRSTPKLYQTLLDNDWWLATLLLGLDPVYDQIWFTIKILRAWAFSVLFLNYFHLYLYFTL